MNATAVAAPGTGTVQSTDAMRAEADQLNASVRDDNRSLHERARRAAQLAWEADLIDGAALCLAELEGARQRVPRLVTARDEAVAAERVAEDRLRADERHLARRRSEERKAEDDYLPAERQEELGIRVRKAERVVAAGQAVVAGARRVREEAENQLGAWETHVAGLDREHAAADLRAKNPGTAPNMPGLAPGVSRISDLDEETRQLLAALVLVSSQALSASSAPPAEHARSHATTHAELAAQDPRGFRFVRRGSHTFALPPAGS